LGQICHALEEVRESKKDYKIKSEAQSLAENEFNFEFILTAVVWYQLMSAADKVSRSLHSMSVHLSMGLQELLQT
jgi:hypothetical protein